MSKQDNTVGGKGYQDQAKESNTPPFPTLRSPLNSKLNKACMQKA